MTTASQTPKPLIGLTGGIASGKSTVARQLEALGVVVVDADALAREVVAKGTAGLAEIVRTFGPDLLTEAGELNRERMGALVFDDAAARQKLNQITHPRIGQLSAQRIAEAQASSAPYVVYEAALLVETGAHQGMQALIVVAAPAELQLARIQSRDGLTAEAAQSRLAAQLPLDKKLAVANYVIHNSSDVAALQEQTRQVHAQILARFGLATSDKH